MNEFIFSPSFSPYTFRVASKSCCWRSDQKTRAGELGSLRRGKRPKIKVKVTGFRLGGGRVRRGELAMGGAGESSLGAGSRALGAGR